MHSFKGGQGFSTQVRKGGQKRSALLSREASFKVVVNKDHYLNQFSAGDF